MNVKELKLPEARFPIGVRDVVFQPEVPRFDCQQQLGKCGWKN